MCSCLFESYLMQCHSRCGDALVVRPLTPWLIKKLAEGSQIYINYFIYFNYSDSFMLWLFAVLQDKPPVVPSDLFVVLQDQQSLRSR